MRGISGKWGNWRNSYMDNERNYVLLFHKLTGKWVGYFPVTSRVTGLAVSGEKLWIGLEDTGYAQSNDPNGEVFAPSPLLEVQKSQLESISPGKWVSDELSSDELKSRIKEAAQILKVAPDPGPVDPEVVAEKRYEFFGEHFVNAVPVEFQKGPQGEAAIQRLQVKDNMLEHDGAYYCGFKFTIPPWLDGDLEWMFVMAKTEAQKDFISHSTSWYILPENGHNWGFDKLRSDKVKNYTELQQQFPYTSSLQIEEVLRKHLTPGQTYAIWFEFREKEYPDIALAMTINSDQGKEKIGDLPLK